MPKAIRIRWPGSPALEKSRFYPVDTTTILEEQWREQLYGDSSIALRSPKKHRERVQPLQTEP